MRNGKIYFIPKDGHCSVSANFGALGRIGWRIRTPSSRLQGRAPRRRVGWSTPTDSMAVSRVVSATCSRTPTARHAFLEAPTLAKNGPKAASSSTRTSRRALFPTTPSTCHPIARPTAVHPAAKPAAMHATMLRIEIYSSGAGIHGARQFIALSRHQPGRWRYE